MRYLKRFNESVNFITDSTIIHEIMTDLGIRDYQIDDDMTVNIYEDKDFEFNFSRINLYQQYRRKSLYDETFFPIKFGNVRNKFKYQRKSSELGLTTLEGSPRSCGHFQIIEADITDLQNSPTHVDRSYRIEDCSKLESLRGCPSNVGQDFTCTHTLITSLEGCPKNIPRVFNIQGNKLKDFRGGPEYVGDNLFAGGNPLTSLEGLPKVIGSRFDFDSPLVWDPKPLRDISINWLLTCRGTKIEHLLRFFHKIYNPNGIWDGGIHTSTEEYQTFIESLDYNWVKGDVNNPKIDLFRLREALDEFGISLEEVGVLSYHIDSLGPYQYVDLDGERVNVWGKKFEN